ncbi:hypothetical protein FOL47_005043 [Perkinsus chesapeaki]|uniref:P-type ATPase A domain-containing protein n=1 Tax=Perkinsus chesapeaki TaxID=330153 RepID=A0A7J6M085_PERCH|nr:hypothetical protein FOL47_005043 [Perkinsus chesapeaki]
MAEEQQQEMVDVPLYAPFYLLNYGLFILIILFHLAKALLNKRVKPSKGHTATVEAEGITELGYRRTVLGTALEVLTVAWMLWMETGMLLLAIGNYYGFWPFGNVTASWDSYTAGFLIAWATSTCLLMLSIRFSKLLSLLYLEPCELRDADYVMMRSHNTDECGTVISHVELCKVQTTARRDVRWVAYQLSRYSWVEEVALFTSVSIFNPAGPTSKEVFAGRLGRTSAEADDFLAVDGKNEIDVPVSPFLTALGNELFNYFYVYQLAAAWLPIFWEYITYGVVLLILSLGSAVAKVFTERRQRFELREMARVTGTVWVKRDGDWRRLTSDLLVQGDLIALMDDDADDSDEVGQLSVDAMIISGSAVCDESLLTGETMPIQKFEVSSPEDEPDVMNVPRDPRTENKKHYVFAGTKLLSASGAPEAELPRDPDSGGKGCLLIVTHRASDSLRGRLLRTLLFGAPVAATWIREIWTVLGILFVLGIIDFIILNAKYAFNLGSILNACTAVIGMISPLLSIAILGGQLASAARLRASSRKTRRLPLVWRCRSKKIETEEAFKSCDDEIEGDVGGNLRVYCRDVARLTLTGRVTQMCFDKTGTLTKTGLDFLGVCQFEELDSSAVRSRLVYFGRRNQKEPISGTIAAGLALTHTVSVLSSGELVGSQVELRMIEAAKALGWEYGDDLKTVREPNNGPRWRVEKQYTFDHHSMTMSAVVTDESRGESYVFCKGSHEAILERCISTSDEMRDKAVMMAEKYASEGCYVLAIASRSVTAAEGATLPRHELEDDLELLGLLLFRNEVKPDSARYIDVLKTGGVDSVMITGDSVYNGAAVARKVGIIPPSYRVIIGDVIGEGCIQWTDLDTHEEVDEAIFCGKGGETEPACLCVTGACFSELTRESQLIPLMGCRGTCRNGQLGPGVRRPGLVDCGCSRIRVFGRMTPHQKVAVITSYSRAPLNLITGMCGDGGNDSGALRAAAAGLALSGRVEASVAAPFSTDSPSIGSLVLLLREARASMCTSFASYRFLVVRGVIGSIGKMILMLYAGAYLTPFGFIYQDLIMNPLLLWALSMPKPARTLARVPPEGSLLGPMMVMAASLTMIIGVIFLMVAFYILFSNEGESWFGRFDGSASEVHEWQKRSDNFEAALTWLWLSWITFDTAVCYSYGDVHRRPVYRNLPLIFVVLLTGIPLIVLLVGPSSEFSCAFKVNCSLPDFQAVQYSWVNWLLFSYERVGGDVWYGTVSGNVMPAWLRWTYFGLFCGMTLIHHLSYKIITLGSFVKRTLPRLGWGAQEGKAGLEEAELTWLE